MYREYVRMLHNIPEKRFFFLENRGADVYFQRIPQSSRDFSDSIREWQK